MKGFPETDQGCRPVSCRFPILLLKSYYGFWIWQNAVTLLDRRPDHPECRRLPENHYFALNMRPIEGANDLQFKVHESTIYLQSTDSYARGQGPPIPINNLRFQWLMPGFECPPAAPLAVLVLLQSKTIGDPINNTIPMIRKHSLNAITKDDFCTKLCSVL